MSFGQIANISPDSSTAQWVLKKSKQLSVPNRSGYSLTYFGSYFLLFGGIVQGKRTNDLYSLKPFDLQGEDDVNVCAEYCRDKPKPRSNHIAFNIDQKLFIFGGTNGSQYFNDFHFYSKSKGWNRVEIDAFIPPPLSFACATTEFAGKFYVFGGKLKNGEESKEMYVFDGDRNKWNIIESLESLDPIRSLTLESRRCACSPSDAYFFGVSKSAQDSKASRCIMISHLKISNEAKMPNSFETMLHLPEYLDRILKSGEYSDLSIVFRNPKMKIRAHRCILSVRNEKLASIIKELGEDREIEITNFEGTAFFCFLRFLYCAKLDIESTEQLEELYRIGIYFGTPDLVRICSQKLEENSYAKILQQLHSDLEKLIDNKELHDITITAADSGSAEPIYACKVILGRAETLRLMIGSGMRESSSIQVPEMSREGILFLARFLHMDALQQIPLSCCMELFRFSRIYQIHSVHSKCRYLILRNLDGESVCGVYSIAIDLADHSLQHYCKKFACSHIDQVVSYLVGSEERAIRDENNNKEGNHASNFVDEAHIFQTISMGFDMENADPKNPPPKLLFDIYHEIRFKAKASLILSNRIK